MKLKDYLAAIPAHRQERFAALQAIIKSLFPDANESMKYKMPTYEHKGGWIAIANQKGYISLYTCSEEHISSFKSTYPEIQTGKGCINFKDKDPLPLEALAIVIKSALSSAH
ncbi:DUF1801 domain-containing protein [Aliiglaciecola sp. CAU 1673]|uniref:iron chaperone n=1 Tax=Aliiglaciecola sp. CAU 1673 TaxID=3032595 RepID=UPI0023DA685D|nr:DUF1801 domain-containing protein [Aliiglaciecola sp. CAU 1673]MDF2179780.1 DUF1801 domain-containing protein [Aliiglaciecola sp. CAU 1673]